MRTFKIYSLSNFQNMQYSIINYSHHVIHYIPMTYCFITGNLTPSLRHTQKAQLHSSPTSTGHPLLGLGKDSGLCSGEECKFWTQNLDVNPSPATNLVKVFTSLGLSSPSHKVEIITAPT